MFGIVFIILANLSGNAIAFGRYVLWASGKDDDKGPTIAIGIAALTVIPLLHAFSRRGGLFVNNIFAVVKIGILLSIIILGFIVRGGKNLQEEQGHQRPKGSSFHPDTFGQAFGNIANYTSAFLLVMFTYSGFEQPFYVLSEVDRPRRYFPRAVISTLIALLAIFVLVNIAYVCVIPREAIMNAPRDVDIVEMFFKEIFGEDSKSVRVMNAFVAISILGNLIVMTFTAAKVKQEIAKEGILPMSLFFATGKPTPTAKLLSRWQNWRRHGKKARGHGHGIGDVEHADGKEHLEQSPMAALLLHWLSSLVLIAVTAKLEPVDSYDFLVSLYAYVIIGVMGFFTSFGLLYAKYVRRDFVSQYKVLAGPTACLLYW
jgi:amino acid transporter